MKIKRLPPRYGSILMPLILSVLMSSVVSFVATLKSIGFVDGIWNIWLQAWAASWIIAFPTLLLMLPIVRWIVGLLVQPAVD